MIYIAGIPLVDPSVRKILKLIKNNTYHLSLPLLDIC